MESYQNFEYKSLCELDIGIIIMLHSDYIPILKTRYLEVVNMAVVLSEEFKMTKNDIEKKRYQEIGKIMKTELEMLKRYLA